MLKLDRLTYVPNAFGDDNTILDSNFPGSRRYRFGAGQAVDLRADFLVHDLFAVMVA